MGFVLSILYFVAYFLGPNLVFGPLANYRIELILAILILIVSIPKLQGSFVFRTPQSLALIGLSFSVVMSILIILHWFGGAARAFLVFIPSIYAYFLICLHCDTRKKLKVLVLMLLFVCVFDIAHGVMDLRQGAMQMTPPISPKSGGVDTPLWDAEHPYVLVMKGAQGDWIYRIRGQDVIHDPNDFGQILVATIPLMFIFWRPKRALSNLVCVILPGCILVTGIYLTHSRGALVALGAVILFATRRWLGSVLAMVVTVGLFVGGIALNFTGGRAISAQSGSDRTDLWSQGLTMLKEHPLFGVGFGQFREYASNTAHNSVVVCAAEVGIVGLFFWSLFLLPTMRDVLQLASPKAVSDAVPVEPEKKVHYLQRAATVEILDKQEVNRLGWTIALSLVGFLAAGWFLSRAFVMALFLLGGLAEAVYEMARRQGMIGPRMPLSRSLKLSFYMMVISLSLVYFMLRFSNLAK
jgi:hypothetical protein